MSEDKVKVEVEIPRGYYDFVQALAKFHDPSMAEEWAAGYYSCTLRVGIEGDINDSEDVPLLVIQDLKESYGIMQGKEEKKVEAKQT